MHSVYKRLLVGLLRFFIAFEGVIDGGWDVVFESSAADSPPSRRASNPIVRAKRAGAECLERRVLLSSGVQPAPVALSVPASHEVLASALPSKPAHGTALNVALAYLRSHLSAIGLRAGDLSNPLVASQSTDARTGQTRIILHQRVHGLEVSNSNLSIKLSRDNRVLDVRSNFVHIGSIPNPRPAVAASQALSRVAQMFGVQIRSAPANKASQVSTASTTLKASDLSSDPIPARLKYVFTPNGLKLAWELVVRPPRSAQKYQVDIDASSGAALGTVGLTNSAAADLSIPSPAPDAPDLTSAADSGVSPIDNITNFNNSSPATALQFTMTSTIVGATITIYANGVAIGSAIAIDTTTLVITDGVMKLTDGVKAITARQIVPGQSQSGDSPYVPVTIDTTPPAAGPAPDLEAASDSGISATDNITNIASPRVDLAGGAPYVRLLVNGALGSAAYLASGPTQLASLPDGAFALTAIAIDTAGNQSAPSPNLDLTIDTTAPTAITLAPFVTTTGGTAYTFTVTYTDAIAVNASAYSIFNAQVAGPSQFVQNPSSASIDDVSNGSPRTVTYQLTPPGGAWDVNDNGLYTVSMNPLQVRDVAGNFIPVSTLATFTVLIPPIAPDLQAATDSGINSSDDITSFNNSSIATALQFRVGQVTAGGMVEVFIDDQLVAGPQLQGLIVANGSTALADGVHQVTSRQYINGLESGNSAPLSITIDTAAPAAPSTPDLESTSDTGSSNSDNLTSSPAPTFDVNVPSGESQVVHLIVDGNVGTGPTVQTTGAALAPITAPNQSPTLFTESTFQFTGNLGPLVSADFNGDGIPDIAAGANSTSAPGTYILLSNGDGTFQKPYSLTTIHSLAPQAGDINNDGKIDLIQKSDSGFAYAAGNGDGTFASLQPLPLPTANGIVQVADLNHDGIADLIFGESQVQPFSGQVYLGTGNGAFQSPTTLTSSMSYPVLGLAVADFNRDGNLDIVISNATPQTLVFLGRGNGTFQSSISVAVGAQLPNPVIGDFNGDRIPDIVGDGLNLGTSVFSVLLGNGDGTFKVLHPSLSTSIIAHFIAGDFNSDGRLDLATAVSFDVLGLLLGDGAGGFILQTISKTFDVLEVAVADVNQDGRLDLVARGLPQGSLGVYLANPGPLHDGVHQYTAWTEDLAGNRSPYSAPLSVTIDTTPPVASVSAAGVTLPGAANYTFTVTYADAGAIDSSTLANALNISGPGGFVVQPTLIDISYSGNSPTATYQFIPPGGSWDIADDGTYTISGVANAIRDVAGNALAAGAIGAIPVGILNVMSAPDLMTISDSGVSGTDDLTNLNNASAAKVMQFSIAGAVPGATVQLFADGILIGSATATSGLCIVTTDGVTTLPDGVHSLTDRQTFNGGTSVFSAPLLVTVDTIAPLAPQAPSLDPASDSGNSNSDRITNVSIAIFEFANLGGDYAQILRNGVAQGPYQQGSTIMAASQPDGTWSYRLRFSDAAGNQSVLGPAISVTIDTVVPQATITPVGLAGNATLIDHATIQFSEATPGFYLGSLSLARDGGENLLTVQQTLTSSGSNAWTLGNLASLTNIPGTYQLTISAAGGVSDIAGNPPGADIVSQWTYNPLGGTAGDDAYYIKADPDGRSVDYWLNAAPGTAPTLRLPRTLASVAIHGMGGNDSITVDESGGGAFPHALAIDSLGGSIALKIIGTTGNDTFTLDGNTGQALFGTQVITTSQLSSVEYTDNGGDDDITVSGPVPLTLNM